MQCKKRKRNGDGGRIQIIMSFREALLKMNSKMRKETTVAVERRSRSMTRGRDHCDTLSCPVVIPSSGHNRSPSYSPHCRSKNYGPSLNIPVATPQFVYGSPKQFIVTKPESYSSDDEEFEDSDENNASSQNPSSATTDQKRCLSFKHMKHFDKELFSFCDLDYEMPPEVRQVLQQEGLDDSTVEACLYKGEAWHRRAMSLRRFQSAKLANAISKKNFTTLPPIKSKGNDRMSKQLDNDAINDNSRNTLDVDLGGVPTGDQSESDTSRKKLTAREEIMMTLTEADDMKWRTEQQQERILLPLDFVSPRLVIISSKVPWSHALSKSVKSDKGNILSVIYDFETWSFDDIIKACKKQLNGYHQGCRAKSVMLLLKGGPGYFYMLKNWVMTPQKLSKPRYKSVRRFWQSIGDMISKLEPEDSKIHVIGADLEANSQGQKLIRALLKVIHPNRVDMESPSEHTPIGRQTIELYFDYRRFLLWRSRSESEMSFYGARDGTRSWSSIEEEIQRRERIRDIMNCGRV